MLIGVVVAELVSEQVPVKRYLNVALELFSRKLPKYSKKLTETSDVRDEMSVGGGLLR